MEPKQDKSFESLQVFASIMKVIAYIIVAISFISAFINPSERATGLLIAASGLIIAFAFYVSAQFMSILLQIDKNLKILKNQK